MKVIIIKETFKNMHKKKNLQLSIVLLRTEGIFMISRLHSISKPIRVNRTSN